MNWVTIFNRLFEIINTQGDTYYGGTRYLNIVREVNYGVPGYQTYILQLSGSYQAAISSAWTSYLGNRTIRTCTQIRPKENGNNG